MLHVEERFTQAFERNPAALVLTRQADGVILEVNRSYEELLGWRREEILGRTLIEFDVYSTVEERREIVQRLGHTGSIKNFQSRIRARDGVVRHVLISMESIELAGETCILSVMVDVTEQRRAEQALRQREGELAFLAEASAILASSLDYERTLSSVAELAVSYIADWCALHILDPDGSVRELAVAHSDEAKVGLARELQRRYPPEPGRQSGILTVVQTQQPLIYPVITDQMLEASARDADHLALMQQLGFRSVIVVPLIAQDRTLGALTLVSAESGRTFGDHEVSVAQDLAHHAAMAVDNAQLYTERLIAEETVRRLNAELEQRVQERTVQLAAANAELEAFAYSVSHDLRAPLRSIDGFSKVLADRHAGVLDEHGLRYLSHIRGAAQDMAELIDALLRLARLSRTEMRWERVDLSALADSIAQGFMKRDPERVVEFSITQGIVAMGDSQLLRVLLENLIGNAWKFSRARAPATIAFGATRTDLETVYFVKDNGAGFDSRYAHKLFGPFQRLHSVTEFEGTGIGLATVQRIVGRHGGQVRAEGTVDNGATFSFTLCSPPECAG